MLLSVPTTVSIARLQTPDQVLGQWTPGSPASRFWLAFNQGIIGQIYGRHMWGTCGEADRALQDLVKHRRAPRRRVETCAHQQPAEAPLHTEPKPQFLGVVEEETLQQVTAMSR